MKKDDQNCICAFCTRKGDLSPKRVFRGVSDHEGNAMEFAGMKMKIGKKAAKDGDGVAESYKNDGEFVELRKCDKKRTLTG